MKMSEEVWKDIYIFKNDEVYDYRNLYQISNKGQIKSLHNGKEKILKQYTNNKGYYMIDLHKNGSVKKFTVHFLVASMFILNTENKEEIDHIDTNKSNNNVENLRWVTRQENLSNEVSKTKHKKAMSNRMFTDEWKENIGKAVKGKNNPRAKKVAQYDLNGNLIKIWDYIKEVAIDLDISYWGLKETLNNGRKNNIYKGFIWKYYKEGETNE